MPTVHLTDRKLKSLRVSAHRRTFWDATLPGFGVRVSEKTGEKVFLVRYRTPDGRRPQITIGPHPALSLADGRDRAKAVLYDVARGNDPAAVLTARKRASTFRELAAEYLERHAKPNKKSWRYDERMIDAYLLPVWGRRKATEIDRADVMRLLDRIADSGAPYAANRVRALVSMIYSFGIGRALVEQNPVRDVRPPIKPRSRERVLSEDEIGRLWAALDEETPLMAAHFRLRLLTAQRGVEVLSMRREDLDGDWWTIPGEIAKNGLAHRVPFSPQVLAILEEIRPFNEHSRWIFPSPSGDDHIRWVGKAAREIRARVGFDWWPHDLRRTATSGMARLGVDRTTLSKVLNHKSGDRTVTAIYDRHDREPERRQALEKWGAHVERIVLVKAEKVRVVGRIG